MSLLRHKHLGVKKRSQQSEKQLAKMLGGRVQPASGALARFKGDVSSDRFLAEDKFTDKESYSVTRKVWDKIEKEAFVRRKLPLLSITISGKRLFVVNEATFQRLNEAQP